MTNPSPEERAEAALLRFLNSTLTGENWEDILLDVIRAAIDAERERWMGR